MTLVVDGVCRYRIGPVSFTADRGTFVVVTGGDRTKSTVVGVVAGFDRPDARRVLLDGDPEQPPGTDTPTGTDPDAKYEQPGYEDKSLGQAVEQDRQLAEELLDETDGDEEAAEERFDEEAAGAPALQRQQDQHRDDAE